MPSLLVELKSSVVPSKSWDIHVSFWCDSRRSLPFSSAVTSGISVSVDARTANAPSALARKTRDDSRAADRDVRPSRAQRDPAGYCDRSSSTRKVSVVPSGDQRWRLDGRIERFGKQPRLAARRQG